MAARSSGGGGAAGDAEARMLAGACPSDCERACRRARCATPRRSASNFSVDSFPPVELSVILKTSTAVLPCVRMDAATTDTLATLKNRAAHQTGSRHDVGWRDFAHRNVCTRSVSSPGRSGTSTRSIVNLSFVSLLSVCDEQGYKSGSLVCMDERRRDEGGDVVSVCQTVAHHRILFLNGAVERAALRSRRRRRVRLQRQRLG